MKKPKETDREWKSYGAIERARSAYYKTEQGQRELAEMRNHQNEMQRVFGKDYTRQSNRLQ